MIAMIASAARATVEADLPIGRARGRCMKKGRQEALEAIDAARDISAVFAEANRALASREGWGDDIRGCAAAALNWAEFQFPIEALRDGASIHENHPEIITKRKDLLSMSMLAAKAVAKELLAPLPAEGDVEERRARWMEVSKSAKKAAIKTLECAAGCSNLHPWRIFGPAAGLLDGSQVWLDAKEYGLWGQIEADVLRPIESDYASLVEIERFEGGASAFHERWDNYPRERSAIRELMEESGASFIIAGPAGGFATIAKGASMLREAGQALGGIVGLANEEMWFGLEGWVLNMRSKATVAKFMPDVKTLGFSHVPSHLGHEWTHLLDKRIEAVGSASQKKALARLREAPGKQEPDQELLLERRSDLRAFATYARLYGCSKIQKRLRYKNAWDVEEPFATEARAAVQKGEACFGEFIESVLGPSGVKVPPTPALYATLRESWFPSLHGGGECVFVREAKEADLIFGGKKNNYWQSEVEMIARIAEAYFQAKGAPRVVAAVDADGREPRGKEAEAFSKAYQALIDSVKAHPRRLANARLMEEIDRRRARAEGIGERAQELAVRLPAPQQLAGPSVGGLRRVARQK